MIHTDDIVDSDSDDSEKNLVTYDTIAEESVEDLENAFRQIYYYDQSYFYERVASEVFAAQNDHCIHLNYQDTEF
jgi:ATP-dependent RNA circularization protein (DNA/RNA ligase family)